MEHEGLFLCTFFCLLSLVILHCKRCIAFVRRRTMAFYTADLLFREDRNCNDDERRHRIIIPSSDENYVSKTRDTI